MSDDDTELLTDDAASNGHEPDTEPELSEGAEQTAAGVGKTIAALPALCILFARKAGRTAASLLTSLLPYGSLFWQRMIVLSTVMFERKSGSDAVSFSHLPNGEVRPEAVTYKKPDDVEEKEGWHVHTREKVWSALSEGRDTERMGKASVIFADEDSHETGSVLQARCAEAAELRDTRPLIKDGVVEQTNITVQDGYEGVDQAVADGGYTEQRTQLQAGEVADRLLDISSHDGHDGVLVSMRKYKELYPETTAPEEMQRQEWRGMMKALDLSGRQRFVLKVLLIAVAGMVGGIATVYLGPSIVEAIFGTGGGGGGGGGGIVPISLGLLGW
jgi:hypothetical protein